MVLNVPYKKRQNIHIEADASTRQSMSYSTEALFRYLIFHNFPASDHHIHYTSTVEQWPPHSPILTYTYGEYWATSI